MLSNLSQVTQPLSGRTEIQTQDCLTPESLLLNTPKAPLLSTLGLASIQVPK